MDIDDEVSLEGEEKVVSEQNSFMSELKEDEWEVEKILDVKKQNNQLKYLVK
jgi:hypothetical protein